MARVTSTRTHSMKRWSIWSVSRPRWRDGSGITRLNGASRNASANGCRRFADIATSHLAKSRLILRKPDASAPLGLQIHPLLLPLPAREIREFDRHAPFSNRLEAQRSGRAPGGGIVDVYIRRQALA